MILSLRLVFPIGLRLIRQMAERFGYAAQTMNALSTRWNGWIFFGLKKKEGAA